jgi:HK97 family phage prohead protease
MSELDELPPRWPVEYRQAAKLDVRYPERIIELVAVPYDVDALVEFEGRAIVESIAPGSFDGVERRANRIKVNLYHDRERSVGTTVALHPQRVEGLVAEIRIGRDPGKAWVLDDAADGILDASIGFAIDPAFEVWSENRTRRRVGKAYLDHIALVPDPAYEDAKVLAVRAGTVNHPARPATPNLDQVRAWRFEQEYSHR